MSAPNSPTPSSRSVPHSHPASAQPHKSTTQSSKSKQRTDSQDDLALNKLNDNIDPLEQLHEKTKDLHLDEKSANSDTESEMFSPNAELSANFNAEVVHHSYGGVGNADWTVLKVRGPQYHLNHEKIRARKPLFKLVHAEVISGKDRIFDVAKSRGLFVDKMYEGKASHSAVEEKPENLRIFDPDFLFIMNFLIPGNPSYNVVAYFQRQEEPNNHNNINNYSHDNNSHVSSPNSHLSQSSTASFNQLTANGAYAKDLDAEAVANFNSLLRKYITSDDEFRNNRLKIIVAAGEGSNWFVKKAIGNKPAILGNKITTTYCYSVAHNYFEQDVDIGSSKVGSGIFKVVKGYAKSITVDMSFVLEGQNDAELPEVLIGGIRMHEIDVEGAIPQADLKSAKDQQQQ
jgi:hypothetical protein